MGAASDLSAELEAGGRGDRSRGWRDKNFVTSAEILFIFQNKWQWFWTCETIRRTSPCLLCKEIIKKSLAKWQLNQEFQDRKRQRWGESVRQSIHPVWNDIGGHSGHSEAFVIHTLAKDAGKIQTSWKSKLRSEIKFYDVSAAAGVQEMDGFGEVKPSWIIHLDGKKERVGKSTRCGLHSLVGLQT